MSDQVASAPQSTTVSDAIPEPRRLGRGELAGSVDAVQERGAALLEGQLSDGAGAGRDHLAVHDRLFSRDRIAPRRCDGRGLHRLRRARPDHAGHAQQQLRQFVLFADRGESAGQYGRLSDAAAVGGRVGRGLYRRGGDARRDRRGAATALAVAPFVDMSISHIWAVAYFGLSATAMMAMIGLIAGLWAEKFDHLAVITNFIIMPLAFLSGTFYSVEILPEPFYSISHVNPVFFLIDGFRYGFIGVMTAICWLARLVCAGDQCGASGRVL
jgi:ABC-2 type transport system permease protein